MIPKYYVSVSLRRDGSSRFGKNYPYGTFLSIGGSWRLTQEEFLKNNEKINTLKVRASYGTTGNDDIGDYSSLALVNKYNDYDGVYK